MAVEYFPIENIACIPLFCETGCYSLLNTRCFCEMIREKRLLQLSVDNYKFDKQILPGLIIPKYCELYGQLGFRYHVTKLLILRYSYCLPLSSLMDMFLLKIWAWSIGSRVNMLLEACNLTVMYLCSVPELQKVL